MAKDKELGYTVERKENKGRPRINVVFEDGREMSILEISHKSGASVSAITKRLEKKATLEDLMAPPGTTLKKEVQSRPSPMCKTIASLWSVS